MISKPMRAVRTDDPYNYFNNRGYTHLFCQPKINGLRALWNPEDHKLYSRGGHEITSVPHINKELRHMPFLEYDGELFTKKLSFNQLNGLVRRKEPTIDSLQIKYHIFDLHCLDVPQFARFDRLRPACLRAGQGARSQKYLREVPTTLITLQQIKEKADKYLRRGHEGIILRNTYALYLPGKNTGNVWKNKPIYETEATFVCFLPAGEETLLHQDTFGSLLLRSNENNRTFACSGMTEEMRENLWKYPPEENKSLITIKYGAWSDKDPNKRVPLYPRFKCLRWDKGETTKENF